MVWAIKEKRRSMTWIMLILGHLVGDYLLQTEWMARNKVLNTIKGWWACLVHCSVYSIITSFFIISFHPSLNFGKIFFSLSCLIFLTHFPIDKTSFAKIWLKKVLGKVIEYPSPGTYFTTDMYLSYFLYWFVYIVADNTMHLILMVLGIKKFFPELIGG